MAWPYLCVAHWGHTLDLWECGFLQKAGLSLLTARNQPQTVICLQIRGMLLALRAPLIPCSHFSMINNLYTKETLGSIPPSCYRSFLGLLFLATIMLVSIKKLEAPFNFLHEQLQTPDLFWGLLALSHPENNTTLRRFHHWSLGEGPGSKHATHSFQLYPATNSGSRLRSQSTDSSGQRVDIFHLNICVHEYVCLCVW